MRVHFDCSVNFEEVYTSLGVHLITDVSSDLLRLRAQLIDLKGYPKPPLKSRCHASTMLLVFDAFFGIVVMAPKFRQERDPSLSPSHISLRAICLEITYKLCILFISHCECPFSQFSSQRKILSFGFSARKKT